MLEDIDDAISRLAGKTTKTGHINLLGSKSFEGKIPDL